MRLQRLRLENFRCYERLELDLHPRLTVLVGENGAGKTAILDALAVGLSPVMRYLSSANQRLSGIGLKDTDIRLEPWAARAGQQRWGASDYVRVAVETTDSPGWDVWKGSSRGKSPTSKSGEARLAQEMERVLESLETALPELLPIFSYYGAQRGTIEIPQRLRSKNSNYGYPASALLGALNSGSDFREMLQWFDTEESAELRANRGGRPEEYEESVALSAVRIAIEQILGERYRNPHFNREHKFVIEAEEGPSPLYIGQLSQGYQSMLALAMDFARRLAIGNGHLSVANATEPTDQERQIIEAFNTLNPRWANETLDANNRVFEAFPLLSPGIMLIDEVDLHLHPTWQQRVLDDLMRAFPLTQFIVTTHSPQVLSTVPAECIRMLVSERDEESEDTRIAIHRVDRQTQGVESSQLLAEVMGTDPVPNIEIARQTSRYKALIQQDMAKSPEASHLRTVLEAHYGEHHPQLLQCDQLIRLQALKRRRSAQRHDEGG